MSFIHTKESHKEKTNKLCRLCGGRSKYRNRAPLKCSDYKTPLYIYFKLDIVEESKVGVVSENFCYKCCIALKDFEKSAETPSHKGVQRVLNQIRNIDYIWTPFDENLTTIDCLVCQKFLSYNVAINKASSERNASKQSCHPTNQCHPAVRKKLFTKINEDEYKRTHDAGETLLQDHQGNQVRV